ncbi:hypothetical protein AYI68_g5220 [Smittium mucronatum]|uniref:Uncharacterized protein n=1 Tax=Smittium mucronatum TaxID=133383 RepID=A0A1R0GUY2_9FUNG|nr:hypothetical protein AYI68_g5220 [Smittium mucronatum]
MKKRKRRVYKAIILITISSSPGLLAECLRKKGSIFRPKDPPPSGIASSRCMTEVTCSQELSSLSMNNSSLMILSS